MNQELTHCFQQLLMRIQLEIHGRLVKTGRLTNHTTKKTPKKLSNLKIYFIWSIEFSPIFAKETTISM